MEYGEGRCPALRLRWRRRTVAGVAALLAGGVLAPAAPAAPFPPRLDLAYQLAVHYWGQEPSACAAVDREVVPHGTLGVDGGEPIAGLATQVPERAQAGSLDCLLWIDRAYAQPILFGGLCALMIHEVGHLLGMGHSPDPGSVMNESPPIPPLCAAKGRESSRVLALERRLRRLQVRRGRIAAARRVQSRRQLAAEGTRFWSVEE